MAAVRNAAPLVALDAVVIDTETTGLDSAKSWIVELAAVRIVGGRLDTHTSFHRRIRPGVPIPASATQIHGIDDSAIASAPTFGDVWPEFSAFVGNTVVIGHTVGYDLAILKRECERAGNAWARPRTLDTRLLAEIIAPALPSYSLEALAAWLGAEITNRHSALGDAMTCARIFHALLPKLREGNIRTLAEAEKACRALTAVLEEHHRAGWVDPTVAPERIDAERTLGRIDSYPYRHRIREIMNAPKFIATDKLISEALAQMMREQISSLFVRLPKEDIAGVKADDAGIITERDLLRALSQHGAGVLDLPVGNFMSKPLAAAPAEAFVYRAIGLMNRLKIRHLGAVDDAGNVVGALSARDLLRLRADEAIALGAEIDLANTDAALATAWGKISHVAAALLAEEVSARDIAAVISRELGALTRRAAVLAERRMRDEDRGSAPCAYAVAVLGSAGRDESLLAMDQDNALFFSHGEPDGAEDKWFEKFGTYLTDNLHAAGVPYCKGGVMAKNSQWRGSLSTWQTRIDHWIRRSNPQDLLSVDIFFDLRGVHGEITFANQLRERAFNAAVGQVPFAKLLVESAGNVEPGLNFLGRFRAEQGRIDLKKSALFGIVGAARALAICHHVVERSTPDRLAGIKALGIGQEQVLDTLAEAQGVLLELILAQQIEDIDHGTPPSNTVAVKRLSARDQARLRDTFRAVAHIDEFARDLLFKN